MFSSYVKQLESHLRGKGWLEMAYIYWFDEPDPKDFAFVRGGMERLKKYAPGLKTMLTEEPVDALAGPIDIWCPVTYNYDHSAAERRRGRAVMVVRLLRPKALLHCSSTIRPPSCVRLWQSWQRDVTAFSSGPAITGPPAAYPDAPESLRRPDGYVSGYSTPKGVKRSGATATAVSSARRWPPPCRPAGTSPSFSRRWLASAGDARGIEDYSICISCAVRLNQHAARRPSASRLESLLRVPDAITRDATAPSPPIMAHELRQAVAEAVSSSGQVNGQENGSIVGMCEPIANRGTSAAAKFRSSLGEFPRRSR